MAQKSFLKDVWNRAILGPALGITTLPLLTIGYLAAAYDQKTWKPFYYDTRHGLHGEDVDIIKLRTMEKTEGMPSEKLEHGVDNPRITKIGGKIRGSKADECLQVWKNVIGEGNMYLVGPRLLSKIGHSPDLLNNPIRETHMPGLVCLDTLRFGSDVEDKDRLACDLEYDERQSFALDNAILLVSVFAVLRDALTGKKCFNTHREKALQEMALQEDTAPVISK